MLQDEEIKQISAETDFTPVQIEKLYSRFAHLDRSNSGCLNKNDLLSIPELALNPLCDRLIQMFFAECTQEDETINFKHFMRVLATFRSTSNGTNITNMKNDNSTHNKEKTPRQQDISVLNSGNKSETGNRQHLGQLKSGVSKKNEAISGASEILGGLHKKLLFLFRVYDSDNDGKVSFNDLRSILKLMVGNYIEDVQLDKIATRAFVEVDEDNDGFIEFSEFCKVFSGKDLDGKLRVKFFI